MHTVAKTVVDCSSESSSPSVMLTNKSFLISSISSASVIWVASKLSSTPLNSWLFAKQALDHLHYLWYKLIWDSIHKKIYLFLIRYVMVIDILQNVAFFSNRCTDFTVYIVNIIPRVFRLSKFFPAIPVPASLLLCLPRSWKKGLFALYDW